MENGILCLFHSHNHAKCKWFISSLVTFRTVTDSVSCQDGRCLHLAMQSDINIFGSSEYRGGSGKRVEIISVCRFNVKIAFKVAGTRRDKPLELD